MMDFAPVMDGEVGLPAPGSVTPSRAVYEGPCPVCGGEMGKEVRAFSYGGFCCLSCRAFFRRAHQETKSPKFHCRNSGKCAVEPASRRRCPKCRLEACYRGGMRPDLVLTHKQKEKRFQRARARKASESTTALAHWGADVKHKKKRVSIDDIKTEEGKTNNCWSEACLKEEPWNKDVKEKWKDETPDASLAIPDALIFPMAPETDGEDKSPIDEYALTKTIALEDLGVDLLLQQQQPSIQDKQIPALPQQQQQQPPEEKFQDARSILVQMLHENLVDFREMALQLRCRLPDQEDWSALFKQNKRLFVNLVVGRYLVDQGDAQLLWLKPDRATHTCNQHLLRFSDLQAHMSDTLRLFGQDPVMQTAYKGFADTLVALSAGPSSKQLLAEIVFFYSGQLRLNNPLMACREFLAAIQKLGREIGRQLVIHSIHDICQTLEAMSLLFEHSGLVGNNLPEYSESVGPLDHTLFSGFTVEEELWLSTKKDDMMEAMTSVNLGPEITMEFVNFAFGNTPNLSPGFAADLSQALMDRLWKVLGIHPEFKELSDANQHLMVTSAHPLFCALIAARLDGVPADEQARFAFSAAELSSNYFLQSMSRARPSEAAALRPVRARDLFAPSPPPAPWDDYRGRVQPLVRRRDSGMTFFSLSMRALLGCLALNKPQWRAVEALRKKYDMVIARRFATLDDELSAQVSAGVADVRILASMLPCVVQQE